MYFAVVTDYSGGGEFCGFNDTLEGTVDQLNSFTSNYNPGDIKFYEAKEIKVKVNITFTKI